MSDKKDGDGEQQFAARHLLGQDADTQELPTRSPTAVRQDLEELLRSGAWKCEAPDHGSPEGCSNPKCIKSKNVLLVNDFPPFHKG
jgi:hypothetical protein